MYGSRKEHPPPTPEEEVRITKRRIAKAERDERMDITMSLTPVKTCVFESYSLYELDTINML